jgi:hypothetical protein
MILIKLITLAKQSLERLEAGIFIVFISEKFNFCHEYNNAKTLTKKA